MITIQNNLTILTCFKMQCITVMAKVNLWHYYYSDFVLNMLC